MNRYATKTRTYTLITAIVASSVVVYADGRVGCNGLELSRTEGAERLCWMRARAREMGFTFKREIAR